MLVRLIGTEKSYRVGKVVCLGRNYAEHIRELGNEVPERPVLFIKPSTSLLGQGGTVHIPSWSRECHHEAELAVLIGRQGKNIGENEALDYVAGYGVAIDLTLRDVQDAVEEEGAAVGNCQGVRHRLPSVRFHAGGPDRRSARPADYACGSTANLRQDASTALMLRKIPQIIREISEIFTLEEGDVLLTGTPAGVSAIASGDRLEAEIEGVGKLSVTVG